MVKGFRKRIGSTLQPISKYIYIVVALFFLSACSIQKAQKTLLQSASLKGAHVGIAVYNDSKQKWVDQYQSDHYFTPASNTKILATYVGLRYLGDSIPGWGVAENQDTLFLLPKGDPSFLHPDFLYQPILDLIRQTKKKVVVQYQNNADHFDVFGDGWAWNDYAEDYQPQRTRMPIYGNVVHFYNTNGTLQTRPSYFFKGIVGMEAGYQKQWTRKQIGNFFYTTDQKNTAKYFQVPFDANYYNANVPVSLLNDTLSTSIDIQNISYPILATAHTIKTVPTDSLLKIMMRRSDNFFAEQVLLMSSEQALGKMDDGRFIDSVLKSDFADLPQKMRWADGSGLSRYNLNTPQNYVAILKKMQDQFGEARVTNIFEKGGEGTLGSYYKNFPGELHAKTGSLGGQIALSGFIFTQKKQKLYFSVLVSNHMSPSSAGVRKAVEAYLIEVAKRN